MAAPWPLDAEKLAALLSEDAGQFGDVVLIPEGSSGSCGVPASRLLLQHASPKLAGQLGLRSLAPGDRLRVSGYDKGSLRAAVALSCGAAPRALLAASELRAADIRQGEALLREGLPGAKAVSGEVRSHSLGDPQDCTGVPKVLLSAGGCIAALAVGLAPYLPAWWYNPEAGGYWSDDRHLKLNPLITSDFLDLRQLFRTDYWGNDMFDSQIWTHKSFRPLTVLSFRWNYLLHGFASSGFHRTNVLLHAVACVQLGFIGRRLFRLPLFWATLIAALSAAHPAHVESVLFLMGRADLLCAQCVLLAMSLFSSSDQRPPSAFRAWASLVAAAVIFVASGLCKEIGFVFFALHAVWETLRALRRRSSARRIAVIIAPGVAACCWRVCHTGGTNFAMDEVSQPIAAAESPQARALTYALVHGMYAQLLVWPAFLCTDYGLDAVPLVTSPADVRLLLPCAAYVAVAQVACVACWLLKARMPAAQRSGEALAVGLAMFLLGFAPLANIAFTVGTVVAERLLYVPSLGFLFALVSGAHSFEQQGSGRLKLRWNFWRIALRSSALLILAAWSVRSYRRVLDWATVRQLVEAEAANQPRSVKVQLRRADALLREGRLEEALSGYRWTVGLDPLDKQAVAHHRAGQILLQDQARSHEAEHHLSRSVAGRAAHDHPKADIYQDRGVALWYEGRSSEATASMRLAVAIDPTNHRALNNFACALIVQNSGSGDAELTRQGLQYIDRAAQLSPSEVVYWRNAAVLHTHSGDAQVARRAWAQARRMSPALGDPQNPAAPLPVGCLFALAVR